MEPIPFKIAEQGAPLVNGEAMEVEVQHDDIILGHIDMRSKRCGIFTYGGGEAPCVYVEATEDSLHLGNASVPTCIEFPSLPGWTTRLASVARYTLTVLLTRDAAAQD